MRYYFPNLTRPKKAAKSVARYLSLPLAKVQEAVANVCGYDDWYDLYKNASSSDATDLDQTIDRKTYIERQVSMSLHLAKLLNIPNGDAQYFLSRSRLTGDHRNLDNQIEIRLGCMMRTSLPLVGRRERGAIGTLKIRGWSSEPVILRSYGHGTTVITHRSLMGVGNFEYISPKVPGSLFLPGRLYLPYGFWTESDGSIVLFSRDYFPLWRIRKGSSQERLNPWLRINFVKEEWFWNDGVVQLDSAELREQLKAVLEKFGITDLPILADALPLCVKQDKINNFHRALGFLRESRVQYLQ
ncbi:MAG TPA: hypothetical protein VG889_01230 [Rhizomicrobium sp.]|nr:hypothetical protein [Rhizomicrobium sp.]